MPSSWRRLRKISRILALTGSRQILTQVLATKGAAMAEGDSKFGFKDMEKALETLKLLESHDMQYRKLTVRGLLGRAKRVLTSECLCPRDALNPALNLPF